MRAQDRSKGYNTELLEILELENLLSQHPKVMEAGVVGVPDKVAQDEPLAYIEGRRGARLFALDARTGEQAAQLELDAPPVWDGMAAAYGKIFMTDTQGRLLCLGAR